MFSVVIPSLILSDAQLVLYNRCVGTLGTGFELVIVDNGSTHGVEQMQKDADVYVRTKAPIGYARAINLGACAATGDNLLFVNNDACITGGDWQDVLSHTLNAPEVGVAIPHLRNEGEFDYSAQLVGCVWGIRAQYFHFLGRLSLDYDAGYYEDTDLFMRVMEDGKKIVDCSTVRVDHVGQATFTELMTTEEIHRLSGDNHKKYVEKFDGKFPVFN